MRIHRLFLMDIVIQAWSVPVSGDSFVFDTVNHISSNLDVVIGELANFRLIHTHDLLLVGCTEVETRDQVDQEEDEAAENE
jgi:hypothetical protein